MKSGEWWATALKGMQLSRTLLAVFMPMVVAGTLPVNGAGASETGWASLVRQEFGGGWHAIALNHAQDAGHGWHWLPQAGVWVWVWGELNGEVVNTFPVDRSGGTEGAGNGIAVNYAYDAGQGWQWLPEEDVWVWVYEQGAQSPTLIVLPEHAPWIMEHPLIFDDRLYVRHTNTPEAMGFAVASQWVSAFDLKNDFALLWSATLGEQTITSGGTLTGSNYRLKPRAIRNHLVMHWGIR